MFRAVASPISVLLIVVFAVLLAGCGEDPDVVYQRELRAVGDRVAASLDAIPMDTDEPIEPSQITRLSKNLREAADDLEGLDAPSAAAERAQKTFVRGLRGVATSLRELSRDISTSLDENKQAERFVEFATDDTIQRSFDDLENAQDAFARAGFRVFAEPAAAVRAPTATPTAAATTAAARDATKAR